MILIRYPGLHFESNLGVGPGFHIKIKIDRPTVLCCTGKTLS